MFSNRFKGSSLPEKGLECLLGRFPPAVKTKRKSNYSRVCAASQRNIIHAGLWWSELYLRYFEELRYPSHSGEELLVNVQTLFTLSLLHVKVFLCGERQTGMSPPPQQNEQKTKVRQRRWSTKVLPSRLMMPSL